MKTFKLKVGDVVEFMSLQWYEPQWDFDYPTVVLSPVIEYSPNCESNEAMIEYMCIKMCCEDEIEDEDVSEEFEWRGWSVSKLKKIARERIAGKDTWKTFSAKVLVQKVRFFYKGDDIEFEVIESKEY